MFSDRESGSTHAKVIRVPARPSLAIQNTAKRTRCQFAKGEGKGGCTFRPPWRLLALRLVPCEILAGLGRRRLPRWARTG